MNNQREKDKLELKSIKKTNKREGERIGTQLHNSNLITIKY
jgi:hypothetical protein